MEPRDNRFYWRLGLALVVPFVLIVVAGAFVSAREGAAQAAAKARSEQRAAERKAKAEAAWAAIPPEEHLAQAAKLLAGKPEEAQVKEARRHLGAIQKDTPEARKAASLQAQANAHQTRIRNEERKVEAAAQTVARGIFAKELENHYLDKGINADVTTSGPGKTSLRIKWALVSKVTAHQLGKNGDFWESMRKLGFKKVVMTDGYDESFSWNVGED